MEAAGWRATYADVRLIATCEEKETGTTRLMKHGETLVVKSLEWLELQWPVSQVVPGRTSFSGQGNSDP